MKTQTKFNVHVVYGMIVASLAIFAFWPHTPSPAVVPTPTLTSPPTAVPIVELMEEIPFLNYDDGSRNPADLGLKLLIVGKEEYQKTQILPELGDTWWVTQCDIVEGEAPYKHLTRMVMSYKGYQLIYEMPSYSVIEIDDEKYRLGTWCQPTTK